MTTLAEVDQIAKEELENERTLKGRVVFAINKPRTNPATLDMVDNWSLRIVRKLQFAKVLEGQDEPAYIKQIEDVDGAGSITNERRFKLYNDPLGTVKGVLSGRGVDVKDEDPTSTANKKANLKK